MEKTNHVIDSLKGLIKSVNERPDISSMDFRTIFREETAVLSKKDMMITTFGLDAYKIMYNFFLYFAITDKYKKKIIKTRRANVLFQIFLDIFEELYQSKYNASFMSDYKEELSYIYNDCIFGCENVTRDFKKKDMLIIDDILIHGRGLQLCVDHMCEDYEAGTVAAAVLLCNSGAECVKETLIKAIKKCEDDIIEMRFVSCKEKNSWEFFSNKIVYAIQMSGLCYSAFVPQYKIKGSIVPDQEKYSDVTPTKLQIQKSSNLDITLIFDDEFNFDFFIPVLRKYSYANEEKIVVPCALLPAFGVDEWGKVYNAFVEKLLEFKLISEEQNNQLRSILPQEKGIDETGKNNFKHNECYKYSYRLITYLLSDLYLLYVLKCTDRKLEKTKTFFSKATFGERISKILDSIRDNLIAANDELLLKDILYTFIELSKNNSIKSPVLNESMEIFENTIDSVIASVDFNSIRYEEKKEIIDKMIREYIDRIHQINEKRATEQKSRLEGAYFLSMVCKLRNKYKFDDKAIRYFVARMCTKWDNGIMSYIADFNEENQYIGGCVVDGEQAYNEAILADSENEVSCFLEVWRATGQNKHVAIDEYRKIIDFEKKQPHLNINKMQSVVNFLLRHHTIEALIEKNYPNTSVTPTVQECITNYKKYKLGVIS